VQTLRRGSISFYLQESNADSMGSGSDMSENDDERNEGNNARRGGHPLATNSMIFNALHSSQHSDPDYVAKEIAEKALDATKLLENRVLYLEEKLQENDDNFATSKALIY